MKKLFIAFAMLLLGVRAGNAETKLPYHFPFKWQVTIFCMPVTHQSVPDPVKFIIIHLGETTDKIVHMKIFHQHVSSEVPFNIEYEYGDILSYQKAGVQNWQWVAENGSRMAFGEVYHASDGWFYEEHTSNDGGQTDMFMNAKCGMPR
jgi:hypothetical protein